MHVNNYTTAFYHAVFKLLGRALGLLRKVALEKRTYA